MFLNVAKITCLTHRLKIPWLICLTGILFHPSCTSLPCLQDIRPECMPIMKHFDPNGYNLVKLQVVVLQITLISFSTEVTEMRM